MKKTILKSILFSTICLVAFQGCKKGENDPFLSLKSRNARITGTWKLTAKTTNSTETTTSGGTTTTETSSSTYDGSMEITMSGGTTSTSSYTREMTINKDGSYSYVVNSTSYSTDPFSGQTTTTTSTSSSDGYWWWLNDAKNKTRIAFDDDAVSYEIDQLKNKEMILVYQDNDSYSSSDYTNTDFDSWTETWTKQ
jgi:hypothetical protein